MTTLNLDPMISITAAMVRDRVPDTGTLEERLRTAMIAVRHPDVCWMGPNDDQKFRAAIAAVAMKGSEEDRDRIIASLKPLQALSALIGGVPVDMEALMDESKDDAIIPLLGLWHDTNDQHGDTK